MCDKGYNIKFEFNVCIIEISHKNKSLIALSNNVYTIDLDEFCDETCLLILNNDPWLWHRRLGQASMKLILQITTKELLREMPSIKFVKDKVYDIYQLGKQIKSSFKSKNQISTFRPL